MINNLVNQFYLGRVLEAAHDGVYIVTSDKLGSAILTKAAYSLFRLLAGPEELKTHSATYMASMPKSELDFLGTLEIKNIYRGAK